MAKNVKELPECLTCPVCRMPFNCLTLHHILDCCQTVKIALHPNPEDTIPNTIIKICHKHYALDKYGFYSRHRPVSKRRHLTPSGKIYATNKVAYFMSLENPQASQLDNWLKAEEYINTNYPD